MKIHARSAIENDFTALLMYSVTPMPFAAVPEKPDRARDHDLIQNPCCVRCLATVDRTMADRIRNRTVQISEQCIENFSLRLRLIGLVEIPAA